MRKGKSNSAMNHFLLWTVCSISVPCEHTLIIKGKCIHSFLTILCLWSFWSPMYRPSGGTFFPISVAFLRWLTRWEHLRMWWPTALCLVEGNPLFWLPVNSDHDLVRVFWREKLFTNNVMGFPGIGSTKGPLQLLSRQWHVWDRTSPIDHTMFFLLEKLTHGKIFCC